MGHAPASLRPRAPRNPRSARPAPSPPAPAASGPATVPQRGLPPNATQPEPLGRRPLRTGLPGGAARTCSGRGCRIAERDPAEPRPGVAAPGGAGGPRRGGWSALPCGSRWGAESRLGFGEADVRTREVVRDIGGQRPAPAPSVPSRRPS